MPFYPMFSSLYIYPWDLNIDLEQKNMVLETLTYESLENEMELMFNDCRDFVVQTKYRYWVKYDSNNEKLDEGKILVPRYEYENECCDKFSKGPFDTYFKTVLKYNLKNIQEKVLQFKDAIQATNFSKLLERYDGDTEVEIILFEKELQISAAGQIHIGYIKRFDFILSILLMVDMEKCELDCCKFYELYDGASTIAVLDRDMKDNINKAIANMFNYIIC